MLVHPRSLAAVGAAVLALSLVGCSESDDSNGSNDADAGSAEAYCAVLTEVRDNVSALNFADISQEEFDELTSDIERLEESASGTSQESWKLLGDTLGELDTSLEDAGVSISDLPQLEQGQVPNGVDVEKLAALSQSLQELLSNPKLADATEQLRASAERDCGIDLGEESNSDPGQKSIPSEPTAS